MKRPERIRVLGKRFTISFVPAAHPGLDDSENTGLCDSEQQAIYIREGQPLESEQDTVLHEVLHAIEHAMDLECEEREIRSLATGLLAVLKDNPTFVRYLAARPHKENK